MDGKSEALCKQGLQHQTHALNAITTCGKWRTAVRLGFDIERGRVQPAGFTNDLIIGIIGVVDQHLQRCIGGAQSPSRLYAYANATVVTIAGSDRRSLE